MATPEKGAKEGEKNFTEKWWKKWLELFQGFLGVKDLEKIVTDMAGEEKGDVVKKAFNSLNGEDKLIKKENFVHKLANLLSTQDAPGVSRDIDKLLNETLNTSTDSEAKNLVSKFDRALKNPGEEKDIFEESARELKRKKDSLSTQEIDILKNAGVNDEEINQLRAEIDIEIAQDRKLTDAESEEKLKQFWAKEEGKLYADEVTQKLKRPTYTNAFELRELSTVKNIYEKIMADPLSISDKERSLLENFLFKQMDTNPDIFEIFFDQLSGRIGKDGTASLMAAVSEYKKEERVATPGEDVEHGSASTDPLNKYLRTIFGHQSRDGARNYAELEPSEWDEMRVSGLLNIDKLRYKSLSAEAKEKLGLSVEPIVVDDEKKIATLNKSLKEEDIKRVNDFFRKKLISEVRMLVDESVRIDVNTADLRATEYVTIMSIMGLSTSMKSDVMNSARRMTFSFVVFNTPQTEEGYRQIKEYAAQIGPEYSIFNNVMKMRESITIKNKEGKEVDVTDLSQIDFVNAASQAIVNQEDRDHYGLQGTPEEVGRLYSDMMMASNRADVRKEDWIPVTRMTLKERLGEEGYIAKLKDLGVIDRNGNHDKDLEKQYLREIGKKYWDYYNGIYVYYLMTRASGEFVGNAHPDNTKFETPAGLNENFNYKMDPSAWMEFLNVYGVQNFPELAQIFRFNGNSSLASKEGGEVLSYLVETEMSPVKKIPSLAEAWFAKGSVPDKKKLAKLRGVFVNSIFLKDQYNLHGKSKHLAEQTTLYEALPQRFDEDGAMKLDPTALRRDFGTARKEMEAGLRALYLEDPSIFSGMDFEFIKKEFSHDDILMKTLNSDANNLDKIVAFARRWGEDKSIFENLSNKRPDDFTKYAIDYHKEWQQAATALGTKPTWAAFIKMMGVSQRILGKGAKIEPIAVRGYEYMVELRRGRVVGEKYVRQVQEKGALQYKDKNYIGELAGRVPVPDLTSKTVNYDDKQANNGKAPSIVSISGFPGEVDEEGAEQNVLSSMRAASILTEEKYKHERKKLAWSLLKYNSKRPLWAEAWDTVSGKKVINYLAIEVFRMPPEYFLEWVIGGTADFAKLWWGYLNGSGGHH